MSVDGRLRNELTRDASHVEVDPERFLGTVVAGGRRKVRIRRAAVVIALAASIAILVFSGPALMNVLRSQHERPAHEGPPPTELIGTYATTIQPTDVTGVEAKRLIGLWQLTIRGDGLITVVTPPGAKASTLRSQYQVEEDRMITTAFASNRCSGVGVYRWSREGPALRFTLVSDACPLRVTIFTAHPWEAR